MALYRRQLPWSSTSHGRRRVSPVARTTFAACRSLYAGAVPGCSRILGPDCCLRPMCPGSARSTPHGGSFRRGRIRSPYGLQLCSTSLRLRLSTVTGVLATGLPWRLARAGLSPAGRSALAGRYAHVQPGCGPCVSQGASSCRTRVNTRLGEPTRTWPGRGRSSSAHVVALGPEYREQNPHLVHSVFVQFRSVTICFSARLQAHLTQQDESGVMRSWGGAARVPQGSASEGRQGGSQCSHADVSPGVA